MSLRTINNHHLQNYPNIAIDRGSVIKPCTANQLAADQFIERPESNWRRVVHDVTHDGFLFILRYLSSIKVPATSNKYYCYLLQAVKYIAFLIIHIHKVYLSIYGHFYPYSLMSLDEVCDEFTKCTKWTEAVVRSFAWHPSYNRCSLAICNDHIYIYEEDIKIHVLRHNQQRKIVDMAWHPINKEILVVATQTHIIIWTISDFQPNFMSTKGVTKLSPASSIHRRDQANGASMNESQSTANNLSSSMAFKSVKLVERVLPPPFTSIQFHPDGHYLYASSPNSSKIAVIDVGSILNLEGTHIFNHAQQITYIRKIGRGFTRLLWSPCKNRMAVTMTSDYFRVFERFSWSSREWSSHDSPVQSVVWSKPTGRMLLVANKREPCLYSLPFLDEAQSKDVGGNKSSMKVLDLTETTTEMGDTIGGRVQNMVWDKNGKRLAISFKDNPESILLYRTVERPTVEFHQMGVIQSDNNCYPLLMEFHDKFKNGSILTICWSDGRCQHVPLSYTSQEQTRNGLPREDGFNNNPERFNSSVQSHNSPPKTPRSMTNFCHVSGNNSISSYQSYLTPINKIQHQTTLFSQSDRHVASNSVSSILENDEMLG